MTLALDGQCLLDFRPSIILWFAYCLLHERGHPEVSQHCSRACWLLIKQQRSLLGYLFTTFVYGMFYGQLFDDGWIRKLQLLMFHLFGGALDLFGLLHGQRDLAIATLRRSWRYDFSFFSTACLLTQLPYAWFPIITYSFSIGKLWILLAW